MRRTSWGGVILRQSHHSSFDGIVLNQKVSPVVVGYLGVQLLGSQQNGPKHPGSGRLSKSPAKRFTRRRFRLATSLKPQDCSEEAKQQTN
ncbi:hypothetical protein M378DRAFT_162209 [Amanita muscaria Koide BX008]|uniref:Uncharacterized protein n=1 Tax=Amanita muscaria (strain Koide BX008) TaxID=946122 RepID=A0A0C2SPU0_AMAMK|nr:hypothetical protein M378DRAFT_162209 [Amanita muscaria Koide BX008]